MDLKTFHSHVKAVTLAYNHYKGNPGEDNLINLQRQIDVLSSLTKKKGFLEGVVDVPHDLVLSEGLACLVDILNDYHTEPALVHKTTIVLNNLANDNLVKQLLTKSYHILPCLANYLRTLSGAPNTENIVQCLRVMTKVSYGCRILYQESYVDELVRFIMQQIQNKKPDTLEICLELMANLCRDNFAVQSHIRNVENVRVFYKALFANLTSPSSQVMILSLAVLHSLCLDTDIGDQVYSAKNVSQTFMLMFNVLVNGKQAINQVVDLFCDVLKNTKFQQAFTHFAQLQMCLQQLVNMFCKITDASQCSKVLELLLLFASISDVRSTLYKTFLHSPGLNDPVDYERLVGNGKQVHPVFSLIYWSAQPLDLQSNAPLLALKLLMECYEEMVIAGPLPTVSPRLDLVLPLLLKILRPQQPTVNILTRRNHCLRQVAALQMLTVLMGENSMKDLAAKAVVSSDVCVTLLEYQLDCNPLVSGRVESEDDWSDAGMEVALRTLELLVKLGKYLPKLGSMVCKYLQDPRVTTFLAHGLTSDNRGRTQVTLSLLSCAVPLDEFPILVLGDSIAAINNKRMVQLCEPFKSEDRNDGREKQCYKDASKVTHTYNHNSSKPELDTSVQTLIDRFQGSFEIKDVTSAEIINVYQHRLQSLQAKEDHLQNLLETKTLALERADRLLADYRSRQVKEDIEATRIRTLLRNSEQTKDDCRNKLTSTQIELDKLQADHAVVVAERNRLSEEHAELKIAFTDKCSKATELLKQRESENNQLFKQVKEYEHQVSDYSKRVQTLETKLSKLKSRRDEMEISLDKLKGELETSERIRKDLQNKVNSLEVVCSENEKKIKEKDDTINKQTQQIAKLNQIAALISQLTTDGQST